MQYEICYLVGESMDTDLERIKGEVEKIIVDEGGVFLETETRDRRKLAYKVEKDIRGTYVARRFTLPEKDADDAVEGRDSISEMNKKLNLYHDILRFLLVRADDLPELKQREIPVPARKPEGRRYERTAKPAFYNRPRSGTQPVETKQPAVTQPEPKVTEAPKESIDDQLNQILNM